MDTLLASLDTLLLAAFGLCALASALTMIFARQPMRVALALIATMVCLGAIYGLLGVHFIAAFQVLIYVGAVMVFMVYVIMLLNARDPASTRRFSRLAVPGLVAAAALVAILVYGVARELPASEAVASGGSTFGLQPFAVAFLSRYWLHFELTSVLLVAAVVGAIAVIDLTRSNRG